MSMNEDGPQGDSKTDYQLLQEQTYESCQGMALTDIIKMMAQVEADKAELESKLKEINARYDTIRLRVIPERFDEDGIKIMNLTGIGRVQLAGDMYVSIPAGKREAAYEYLRDIGKGSLITPNVNPSTLKAAVKAMMKAGTELPEDLFKITPFTRASITKG